MKTNIIIPTLNADRTLQRCISSIKAQVANTDIVVVDCGSNDDTLTIAEHFQVKIIHSASKGFSVQRNLGAKFSTGDVLGFIDADMILGATVIEEASNLLIRGEVLGVVVPEVSFGDTYWARVRAYERSFYAGEQSPEAARFFLKSTFEKVGGYDERLASMEDFALDRAIRRIGVIGRTNATIQHDEGNLHFLQACKKKANYAAGMVSYSQIYGRKELRSFLFDRDYLRVPYRLMRRPLLGVGVVTLKFGEATAVVFQLLRNRWHRRSRTRKFFV